MKILASVMIIMTSLNVSAQSLEQLIENKIERLNRAASAGRISGLNRSDKEEMNRLLSQSLVILRDDRDDVRPLPPGGGNHDPFPGPRPGPFPGPGEDWRRHASFDRNQVVAYNDDACGNPVSEIRANDRCERLTNIFSGERVWSVSINGLCTDIVDTTFKNSCDKLVPLAQAQKPRYADLTVYTDDSCTNTLTVLDPGVDCNALGNVLSGSRVRSVKLDNKCVNITDTTFTPARCSAYQDGIVASYENNGSRRRGEMVELFTDDGCAQPLSSVVRGTSCSALNNIFNNQRVWSVRFRGQCQNIPDTTFLNACNSYSI